MLGSGLCSTLLLAATCLLMRAGFSAAQMSYVDLNTTPTRRVTTCDDPQNVHRLSCDTGVITVEAAFYGRADMETCSESKPLERFSKTDCSQTNTLSVLKTKCDGKKVCETNMKTFHTSDPCFGIYKYLDTNFTCTKAMHAVTCEHSYAHLKCEPWKEIFVLSANYGRSDRTTCSHGRHIFELININCLRPTSKVAESCDGRSNCTIKASNAVFGEPCSWTYKYLEVVYRCDYRPKHLHV